MFGSPAKGKSFSPLLKAQTVSGATQPHMHRIVKALFLRQCGRDVNLLYRLRTSLKYLRPLLTSWHVLEKLYIIVLKSSYRLRFTSLVMQNLRTD
jgi:hypothetical protein